MAEVWVEGHTVVDLSTVNEKHCWFLKNLSIEVRFSIYEEVFPTACTFDKRISGEKLMPTQSNNISTFRQHQRLCHGTHAKVPNRASCTGVVATRGRFEGAPMYSYLSCSETPLLLKAPISSFAILQTCKAVNDEAAQLVYSNTRIEIGPRCELENSRSWCTIRFLESLSPFRLGLLTDLEIEVNTATFGFFLVELLMDCTGLKRIKLSLNRMWCVGRSKVPNARELVKRRIALTLESLTFVHGVEEVVLEGDDFNCGHRASEHQRYICINDPRARGSGLIAAMTQPRNDDVEIDRDRLNQWIAANIDELMSINAQVTFKNMSKFQERSSY